MNITKLTHQEIVERQSEKQKEPRLPFCVVLNNIRSLYNVGSIFRTADGAGLEKIWLCGITGCPQKAMISKTALGAEDSVAWEHRKDARVLIGELKEKGYQIVLLEQSNKSVSYQKLKLKKSVCLVLGNEISGVSEDLVELCDNAVEIEMAGLKNSLNVSVAFGIIAYHVRNYYMCLNKKDSTLEKK